MPTYTTGREPINTPGPLWQHLPSNARYARLVLPGCDGVMRARHLLTRHKLEAFIPNLRLPTSVDAPVKAIEAHARDTVFADLPIFVVYRIDADALGERLPVPRLLVGQYVPGYRIHVIGRVRRDGDGYTITSDDDTPDPAPVAGTEAETTDLIPEGGIGYLTRSRQRRLLDNLAVAGEDVERTIRRIVEKTTDDDPRTGWHRGSSELLALSATFAAMGAEAAAVELVIQGGQPEVQ